jgi:hypothetical protein
VGQDGILRVGWQPALAYCLLSYRRVNNPPQVANLPHVFINRPGGQMKRFLVMLEQNEAGFAVQVPDLAIVTYGESIEGRIAA